MRRPAFPTACLGVVFFGLAASRSLGQAVPETERYDFVMPNVSSEVDGGPSPDELFKQFQRIAEKYPEHLLGTIDKGKKELKLYEQTIGDLTATVKDGSVNLQWNSTVADQVARVTVRDDGNYDLIQGVPLADDAKSAKDTDISADRRGYVYWVSRTGADGTPVISSTTT